MSAAISTAEAYSRCEAITRAEAANFYYGIRLLSGERRRAMCAAYAFARRIDDIGDGTLAHERKLTELNEAAAQLAELERSGVPAAAPSDPVIVALADAHARFSLPAGALGELIDGVRMDVDGVAYESFDELVLYCRRVAGAIGRVCLAIFATRERAGRGAGASARSDASSGAPSALDRAQIEALADDLGVALQLTNILRDVREDALNGRVYLPSEDLRSFEVGTGSDMAQSAQALVAAAADQDEALIALMRFEAARARQWFTHGMQLVPLLDRRSAACVAAMAGIYHRLLGRIEADPSRALRERMSLSAGEKALVALRSLAGRTT
jgi:phytoene synthase